MISFSMGREDIATCHLQVDLVDSQYRPLLRLLTDHLSQGVWRCCLYSGWRRGDQQRPNHLDPLAEDMEEKLSEYDEPQESNPLHTVTSNLQHLDLDSGGGVNKVTRASAPINQFSMKEMERGEGRVAFEDYLHAVFVDQE